MLIDWSTVKPHKELTGGHHSAGVWLLEGGKAVRKRVDMKNVAQKAAFEREVRILKYLTERNCPHTPALLHVDSKKGELIMSYCGTPVFDTKASRSEEAWVRRELRRGWKVAQAKPGFVKRLMYWAGNGRYLHNVARGEDGRMRLIDFGSKSWGIL
jgi:hypothetical protein